MHLYYNLYVVCVMFCIRLMLDDVANVDKSMAKRFTSEVKQLSREDMAYI